MVDFGERTIVEVKVALAKSLNAVSLGHSIRDFLPAPSLSPHQKVRFVYVVISHFPSSNTFCFV